MAAKTENGTESDSTFWTVESGGEEDYWTAYESMRPKYAASSFLENIYDYHGTSKAGGKGTFDVAHDIACGNGKATLDVAKRFRRMVASDSNASSLTALRQTGQLKEDSTEYVQCAAEELASQLPPQSTDLITAAQCWPILDSPATLSSLASVLKPNGTLAVWFYGRPHFTEAEYKKECQPIFDRIMDLTFGKIIKGGTPASTATWKRAADGMESWLDNMDLSGGQWDRVQRRKWNSKSTLMGFGPEAVDFKIEPRNRVAEGEEVIEVEDPEMWKGEWDIKGVRKYINYCFPGIQPAVEADAEIMGLFEQLEKAMGGEHGRRPFTWPVVLVLASRSES